jgi:starch synthase
MTARSPRLLFVSAEAFPLAKTGGLGDVGGALPAALAACGTDVRLMLPGYASALDLIVDRRIIQSICPLPAGGRLIEGRMPDTGLPVILYDAPALFGRNGTLYRDEAGNEWGDNHLRYAGFCHAAAAVALGGDDRGWRPDLVHANDWHTGLVPAFLAGHADRPATVFTIHNLAFQGNFPMGVAAEVGVPANLLTPDGIEFFGQMSFIKAGLRFADRLTTVSPTYAKEILTPEYGCGLDGLLRARQDDLVGILNGIDGNVWDPATDVALPTRYAPDSLAGKQDCKAAIRQELGFDEGDAPLIVFLNRLTHQKMADVLLHALPQMLDSGAQIVLHGQGDAPYEAAFASAAVGVKSMAVRIGYDEAFARRLTAAADMSITAARFEPCGLTTMYAMKYGALPLTRHVGGIADTVVDPESPDAAGRGGTGFVFDEPTGDAMAACLRRATDWFRQPGWRTLQSHAMRRDFGWELPARRYLAVYRSLLKDEKDDRPEAAADAAGGPLDERAA